MQFLENPFFEFMRIFGEICGKPVIVITSDSPNKVLVSSKDEMRSFILKEESIGKLSLELLTHGERTRYFKEFWTSRAIHNKTFTAFWFLEHGKLPG